MFVLEIQCTDADRDLLIAELWDRGSAGIFDIFAGSVFVSTHPLLRSVDVIQDCPVKT